MGPDRWPVGCTGETAATSSVQSSRARSALVAARGVATVAASAPPPLSSNLTDQNDLYAEALTAQRKGDVWGAVGAFDRLCARFPSSPLAESAAVERLRLLRDASPSRARAAAQQYLLRYPDGYAHAEAEGIVATSP